jgi:hypothetical protein
MLYCPTFVFIGERLLRCLICWGGCWVCIGGTPIMGETGERGAGCVLLCGNSGEGGSFSCGYVADKYEGG